jgi:hypothetical protein
MNLVENINQLSQVFNKYDISSIDFREKLTIVLPTTGDIDSMFADFLSNVELSKQHKYVGKVVIDGINIFNDLQLYNILLDSTHLANKIINESELEILSNNTNVWKIFIYNNMMWDLPFTLEDVIFLPVRMLDNARTDNSIYSLVKTLIHEKIHVLQRTNVNAWVDYVYARNRNWIKVNTNTPLFNFLDSYDVDKLMNRMRVFNPDVTYLNFKYVYKVGNNLYYGVLYATEERILKVQWFLITEYKKDDYDKENITFTLEPYEKNIMSQEHPFEEYAYLISDKLTDVSKLEKKQM